MSRFTLCSLVALPLAFASCTTVQDQPRTGQQAQAGSGELLRAWPAQGTRYLTAVGLPEVGAVTLPDWVVNPTLDGVLGSVGVASHNQLGTSHQLDDARSSARLEIARMLEVRVQDVERREVQQRLQVEGQGDIADNGSSKAMIGVDRSIADSVLAGSRQRALWFDPSTGDCYVWMVMDGAVKTKADHYVENGVSVYVANTPVTKEFRPEQPKQPTPAPAPAPQKAPEPPKGPVEQLESRLKPIETIPIKAGGAGKEQGK